MSAVNIGHLCGSCWHSKTATIATLKVRFSPVAAPVKTYQIGEIGFVPETCELLKNGHLEHLQPQVRNVLLCLVTHAGQVVDKDTLLKEAWGGRAVTDESLTRCISILRKHLSDRGDKHLIETISKVGYRLHCDVTSGQDESYPPVLSIAEAKPILTGLTRTTILACGLGFVAFLLLAIIIMS